MNAVEMVDFCEGFTLLQMLIEYNCYQDVNKCVVLQMLQM